jgi:gentisate 1,2-dioxygenase
MGKETDLLEYLFRWRDEQREMVKNSAKVVQGDTLHQENNRMGLYRWYLHPAKKDVAIRSMLLWVQEIPPGSRSGKQCHQGGRVHRILEGRGYTVIDDVKYEWEKDDILLLPIKPDGVIFQHFNADPDSWVRMAAAEPNWFDALGVDLGVAFEQLEDSPDYKPAK